MSQITRFTPTTGPGSGTVTSVSGGNLIAITGVATVNPTVSVSGGTNGQVIIGATAGSPAFATISSAGGSITFTLGANTLNMDIAAGFGNLTWSVISANQTAVINNGYFCNKVGTLALALPAVSAVGDIIEVSNINTALGIQFTQAAGQQVFIGNASTTVGVAGTLTTTAVGDSLKMVCSVANLTWRVVSMTGNWTPA